MRACHRLVVMCVGLGLLGAATAGAADAAGTAGAAGLPGNDGSFVLSAHGTGARYAPTFTGNGLLGVRVASAGQGYAGGTVPAQSELAGFYAKPSRGKASALVQQRANIPTWSTLGFSDGGRRFSPSSKTGRTSGWRQSLDLRTGVISTSAHWTAPDGHTTDIAYHVFTDRAREHVGVVQLILRPHWTGTATVSDELDGTADRVTGRKLPPVLTRQGAKGWDLADRTDWESVQALGTGITAALADQLSVSPNITSPVTAIDRSTHQSVGQRIAFAVTAGQTYTLTKFVGVDDSQSASDPIAAAQLDAAGAASAGYAGLRAENDAAWAAMWDGRIDVRGDRTVATDVNASEFYLWSSTRDDVDWSVSPAGLSSNGYDGHIFWDAETWMYPSLLAQHPELAAAMEAYRLNRLSAAERHATATGSRGARFPWESALDGTEQIPPPVSVNSEGLYEQHITADVALAQWQYFEATGDTQWLRAEGWPVISGAATFWASRAVRGAGSTYHLHHVTGPDEENPNVSDEAFTNVGARTTLEDAIAAARVLGEPVPASWPRIAAGLVVPVKAGIHPEYAGYRSQLVKQADVTLLPYPWRFPMSAKVEQADLNFYVPRTDPGGPSMDDAVSSIDSSQLGSPGCSSFVFTQRSYRAVHQGRLRSVLRDPDRRGVHVHDRDRRLPAGVPVRLLGAALADGSRPDGTQPRRPAERCDPAQPRLARASVRRLDRSDRHRGHAAQRRRIAGDHAVGSTVRGGRAPADAHDRPARPQADLRRRALSDRRGIEQRARRTRSGRHRRQPGHRLAAGRAAGDSDHADARGPAHVRSRGGHLGPPVARAAQAQRASCPGAGQDAAGHQLRPPGLLRRLLLAHRGHDQTCVRPEHRRAAFPPADGWLRAPEGDRGHDDDHDEDRDDDHDREAGADAPGADRLALSRSAVSRAASTAIRVRGGYPTRNSAASAP